MPCSQALSNILGNLCIWKIAFFFGRYGLTPESLASILTEDYFRVHSMQSPVSTKTPKAQFFIN